MNVQKLSKETFLGLQGVLQDEYKAFYFYRSASNWFGTKGFSIAAEFCKAESDDESRHAKIIEQYMVDWNFIPALPDIESPVLEFKNPVDFLNQAYELEFDLYQKYELLAEKLLKAGDIGGWKFVQQFIDIQNTSVIEYSDKLNITEGVNADSKFEMLLIEKKVFK